MARLEDEETQIITATDDHQAEAFEADQELESMLASTEGTPQTVIAALRQRREQLAVEHNYDVEVPGYGGLLVIRLKPISASLWTRLADRVTKAASPERNFNLNADTMIATCRCVLGRARRDDPLVALVDGTGEQVRLDDRLAELLGISAKTARDVVRGVFSMANSPELAVNTTIGEYVDWCREANADLEDELLGEA